MAEDRMLNDEILLGLIKANSGGGGGGTTNYNLLSNKPQIAGTELQGNKSLADLGIASAQSVSDITNGESINNFAGVEDALSNVQPLDGVVDPSGSVGEDKNLYMKLSGSLPSAMKVTSLKFEVTARRGGGSGMIEYSRLGFYDADGNKYNWPQGTTWSSSVTTFESDPIGSSKMLQTQIPAITTINLPGGEYIDTSVYKLYGWNTGNYSGENCQRDPVSWKLYLSEDKTNYVLRDVRSNQTITTSRNTLAFKDEFNTLPPEFPFISDIFYKKGGVWLKDAFAQQSEVDAIKDGQSIDSFADVETALATKQNATDNSLQTTDKTIVGAINEHEGDVSSLKSGLTNQTARSRSNITSRLTNLATAVAEQNLEKYGYKIGDYFTGASGYTYYLADMDTFYGGYNNNAAVSTHHISLVVKTEVNSKWAETNDTSGGYKTSTLHSYLSSTVLDNIKSDMIALFGGSTGLEHLVSHKLLWTTATSAWAWSDNAEYISALSEPQLYGTNVWAIDGYQTGEAWKWLEIFHKFNYCEILGNIWLWLRSISSASDACLAYNGGHAYNASASYSGRAVGLIIFH